MALPPSFLDELRARTPLAALVGRRVKLKRSGKNWAGCCPFHNERSPSFYVYEDGYHCFGCGAHGDAISFAMQTQGLPFPEAVAQLAAEAGLEVPKPSPRDAEQERRRLDLHEVLDHAAAFFQRLLFAPEGAAALAYLRGRHLTDETIRRFGLGWSGEGRGQLAAALAKDGADAPMLLAAGLLRENEGGPPRDMFFGRVMFPIRDRRGRVISFGGRTLGDAKPKYVNGPETELFQKKRTLYGLDGARDAARAGGPVVAVEGYMDVIALHQAGFGGAVAPLGTALTAEQLEEMWRLHPVPVLCFDGDAAGARAALRAMDTALPTLAADRTLRLATLPRGEDPDTLVARAGAAAFQAVLDGARPLADALFDALREGVAPTPEARAGLRAKLDAAAARIGDKGLASEYRQALRDKLYAAGRAARAPGRGGKPAVRASFSVIMARPKPEPAGIHAERIRNLFAILLRHPGILRDVEEAFAGLDLPEELDRLRHALLDWADGAEMLDAGALLSHLNASGLAAGAAQVLSAAVMPLPACARPGVMPAEAEAGWWHLFGLMNRARLEQEVAAARRDFASQADDAAQRRLIALCTALDALHLAEAES